MRYGSIDALKDVSLKIRVGVTGLLGPNGCGGRTHVDQSLFGLLKVQSGKRAGWLDFPVGPQDARISYATTFGYLPEGRFVYVAGWLALSAYI